MLQLKSHTPSRASALSAPRRALGDALAAREELISALLRGAAAQGTPEPSCSDALALSSGYGSERRTPGSPSAGLLPCRAADSDAATDALNSEAGSESLASKPAEASNVCNHVDSVVGSPAFGGTAQRDGRRTGEIRAQGSSCSSGGGGSTGLSGEPSAGLPRQSGHASAFSSILQRSGSEARASLTPESLQLAGGAYPGGLGLGPGSQALACPAGLSPLAVLATPAALPSWLDRQAWAAPCLWPTGQGLGLLQALPAPLSPLPTPAWLRATPPAEGPQPGETSADSAGTPPEPAGLRLMWGTPSPGVPARQGGPPLGGTGAEAEEAAAGEPGNGALWLTRGPGGAGSCSARSDGHRDAKTPAAACATTYTEAGRGRGSPSAQGSAKGLLASRERGSSSAQCLAEGSAKSPALAGSTHSRGDASSSTSPSFQGFRAPLTSPTQANTQPLGCSASVSPSVAAAATARTPGSPQADSAQGASLSTLDLSPIPHQGLMCMPDTAERQLVDRLRAQLEAGGGSPQAPGHAHCCAGAAPAAAERRATFVRAIDRLQVR